jgi:hypothetical protein
LPSARGNRTGKRARHGGALSAAEKRCVNCVFIQKKEKLTPAHDDAPYLRADAFLALPHNGISKYKQIQIARRALARSQVFLMYKCDIILSHSLWFSANIPDNTTSILRVSLIISHTLSGLEKKRRKRDAHKADAMIKAKRSCTHIRTRHKHFPGRFYSHLGACRRSWVV